MWYLPRAAALAALLGLAAGCAPAQLYSNAQEAGAAAKDYVDEKTDRREDLRGVQYDIEDRVIELHLDAAKRAERDGRVERAIEHYMAAYERARSFYPDAADLVADLRNQINAARGGE